MPIKLLISDVDGTLVTRDKRLPPGNLAAVARLRAENVEFTIVSSRPPIGMRRLAKELALTVPMGAFNGAMIIRPDCSVAEQHLIPESVAGRALGVIKGHDAQPWLYTSEQWIALTRDGPYVAHEIRTIEAEPVIVSDSTPYLGGLGKIVAASSDFEELDRCETAMREALGGEATVTRSQRYYLDITPPGVDKGTFVDALSRLLGIERAEIAVIGDMQNDLAMFRRAGLAIAMGNADERVKAEAAHVTGSNDDDGFAAGVEAFILPGAR
jgi:hypothetical protein